MKTLIVIAALLTASISQANTHSKQVIDAPTFIKDVQGYLGNMSADKNNAFRGELSEVGGECYVTLEKDSKGRMNIVLKSEKGFKIDAIISNDDKVKLSLETDSDGSFSKTFSFGFGGVHVLTIVHVDDAYDHVSLKTGTTSMSCEADY